MSAPKKKAQPAELTYWDDLLAALDENNRLLREIVEMARAKADKRLAASRAAMATKARRKEMEA